MDNPGDGSSPVVIELKARPTVALSGTAEWDDGMRALAEAVTRLRTEMGKAGLEPAGKPLAVFVETDDKGFRFEAMIPLAAAPEPMPGLQNGLRIATSPAGKTMKFEHRGSYDEIDATYEAITAYLDEKGLEAQNLFVEEYLNLPRTSDEDGAQVDIFVFLK
jgi:effector-binding domain-containing protein